ncbi:adenylate/guanylate cyclase domain-containing protein [Candidatus Bathyarchaeota archaeon]|nr:MAG: adenylate/guanylate cyclase domain-containing protein [Candidatus Bathyarchaeota archaeon]
MRAYLRRRPRESKVEIVVLYADIRDFSRWSNSALPGQVAQVVEICYERVHQLFQDFHHSFHKLLGDGFLLVWEVKDFSREEANKCHRACGALRCAINAAYEIHKKYLLAKRSLPFSTPDGFGISIAVGQVYRIRVRTLLSELDEDDYVGYAMNAGSRLQRLAGPNEIILDSAASRICRECPNELLLARYPDFELRLVDPSIRVKKEAEGLKGLKSGDARFFKYLVSPSSRDYLRKADGNS